MRAHGIRRALVGATAMGAALALAGSGVAAASTESATGTLEGSASSAANDDHTEYGFYGWEHCPLEELVTLNPDGTARPGPVSCFTFVVREGTMTMGDIDIEFNPDSMMLTGGMHLAQREWKPESGWLHSNPVSVPGGAFGTGSEDFGPLGITAHVEEAGQLYFNNTLADMYLLMPIRIRLENPLLGGNCYIGSEENPINLKLQVDTETLGGIQNPIVGDDGETHRGILYPHPEASDDEFSVPAASGCGLFGSLNWMVNLRAGLPSPSGENSMWVKTSQYSAQAHAIWNDQL